MLPGLLRLRPSLRAQPEGRARRSIPGNSALRSAFRLVLKSRGQRNQDLGFSLEPATPDADPDPGEGLSACRFEVALSPVSFASPTVDSSYRSRIRTPVKRAQWSVDML